MIVIHPTDPSTRMLGLLYKDLPGVTIFDSWKQRSEILEAISTAPQDEPILLLGHGSPGGLLDMRYGYVIRDEDAPLLRDRPNLVGIWCYASDYASKHGLKGFFSGMFISEPPEAWMNDVEATDEEVDEKVWDFSRRFGEMIHAGLPLEQIAAELSDPRHITSPLTEYNYSRLTFRKTGREPLPVPGYGCV